MITDIKQINTDTEEGKMLMAALAKITTESQTDKTPYEVLEQLNSLKNQMAFESHILSDELARANEAINFGIWLNENRWTFSEVDEYVWVKLTGIENGKEVRDWKTTDELYKSFRHRNDKTNPQ